MKDLTNSQIERRNVLNNNLAVKEIHQQIEFRGVRFDDEYRFTKQQVAEFFEVDERTIERLLEQNSDELTASGYEVFSGNRLRQLKLAYDSDINVAHIANYGDSVGLNSKTSSIGVFTFKSFLNVGMLLTVSDRAKRLRGATNELQSRSVHFFRKSTVWMFSSANLSSKWKTSPSTLPIIGLIRNC